MDFTYGNRLLVLAFLLLPTRAFSDGYVDAGLIVGSATAEVGVYEVSSWEPGIELGLGYFFSESTFIDLRVGSVELTWDARSFSPDRVTDYRTYALAMGRQFETRGTWQGSARIGFQKADTGTVLDAGGTDVIVGVEVLRPLAGSEDLALRLGMSVSSFRAVVVSVGISWGK